jgi:hypothetical protein
MIKSTILQVLAFTACEASVIRRHEPKAAAPATPPPPPPASNPAAFLGPLAGILSGLKGKDPLIGIKEALPQAKLVSIKTLPPRVRTGAKRVAVRYGPYKLAGKGVS